MNFPEIYEIQIFIKIRKLRKFHKNEDLSNFRKQIKKLFENVRKQILRKINGETGRLHQTMKTIKQFQFFIALSSKLRGREIEISILKFVLFKNI